MLTTTFATVPPLWPAWGVMWCLAFGLYAFLKLLTWLTARRPLGGWRRCAYLLGWPGMDPVEFAAPAVSRATAAEWCAAGGKTLGGLGLVAFAAVRSVHGDSRLIGWLGMAGIVLSLHCGMFHLLSCLWRTCGANAVRLMDAPLRSQSLAEFWGRRWNRAFRDLTHRYLFTPLRRRCGAGGALLAGFLVSGLIHDLVISVPAGAGYGGPTMYFLLQGIGLLVEKSRVGGALGLGRGRIYDASLTGRGGGATFVGRAFAWLVVVAPCGWLFHEPFVVRVILPFLRVLEALT